MVSLSSFTLVILYELFLTDYVYSNSIDIEEIRHMFNKNACIPGTLTAMESGTILLQNEKTSNHGHGVTDSLSVNEPSVDGVHTTTRTEKNSLSLIHELATYNEIDYYYYLVDEKGPPHDKTFIMELHLGTEKYTSGGTSMKNAKNAVAQIALQETQYEMPPEKLKVQTLQTPTVQLNNMATKLGMKVTYVMHNDIVDENELLEDQSHYNTYNLEIVSGKNYLSRLNHSVYHPYKGKNIKIANETSPGQPFSVVVYVGEKGYPGIGYTIQAARHDAAANALKALSKLSPKEVEECLATGETCNKNNNKSPISLVYETAQKQKLHVEFETVGESGPAHDKIFVIKCQVGDLVTEGEGKSKKVAKRIAAEKMLKKLEESGDIIVNSSSSNLEVKLTKKKKKRSKKNKNVIKNVAGKLSRDIQNSLSSAYEYFVPDDSKKPKDKKPGKHDNSNHGNVDNPKEVLLDLMQQKGVPVNFLDLLETSSKRYSLLSLGIHPQHLCLGEGDSFGESHQNASLAALKFLNKFDFSNIRPSKNDFIYIDGINYKYVDVSKDMFLDEES